MCRPLGGKAGSESTLSARTQLYEPGGAFWSKKKVLVGALKHLQLHESNVRVTTNVNTPLNKTLV